MTPQIRPCADGEFGPVLRACEQAFGRDVTDEDLARWSRVVDPRRLLAAFDGDAPIGTAGSYALTVTVPGGFVPAAGVTMVATLPTYRRRGLFAALMKELLQEACRQGEVAAVLWASQGGLYEPFGFGLGSRNASIDIETAHAAFRDEDASPSAPVPRLVDLEEAATRLPPIYDAVRRMTPGFVERTPAWWQTYRLDDPVGERGGGGPLQCCVFSVGGIDEGYVLYRIHDAYERRIHHDWIEVVEAVQSSTTATRAIWTYLFGMSLVERVRAKFLPEDHPLTLMLREPGSLRLTVWDGLWLRLIDVRAALAARSYSGEDTIVLEVVDPLFADNGGRWRIDANASGSEVNRSNDPPDIRLGVADLASVYLGAFTFADMHHAGRLLDTSDGMVARATAMFQRQRAPWCPEVI